MCRHRGPKTGDLSRYQSRRNRPCDAKIKLPVYRCAIHGRCTLRPNREGLACCQLCESVTAG